MTSRIDREELRALVRQALREALGDAAGNSAPPAVAQGLVGEMRAQLGRSAPARITVTVGSDADLDRFARDVVHAAEHQDLKAALMAGNVRFALSTNQPQAARQTPRPTGNPEPKGTFHMTSGVLTESKIAELAATNARIIVGTGVVLTPLARDRAREVKVELVRQKP